MVDKDLIKQILIKIKCDIKNYVNIQCYDRALTGIDCFARTSELINLDLRDNEIEEILIQLSSNVSSRNFETLPNRIIFYDQVGTTKCLSLQYIQSLYNLGYEILYIFENPYVQIDNKIIDLLDKYRIKYVVKSSHHNHSSDILLQNLYGCIESFKASKIFVHSPCYGALACVLLSALNNLTKYRVVPGDHHFFIGYNCVDKFIQYRDWGCNFAVQHRGCNKNEIIKIPFYPVMEQMIPFKGFPIEGDSKVIFCIAGNPYKFSGDNYVFDLCKWILSNYPESLIYYIGKNFHSLRFFYNKFKYKNRFVVLGYRDDFSECIKNIDILISSYPITGDLISQIAAFYKKPIVAYNPSSNKGISIREALGVSLIDTIPISKSSIEEVRQYVHMLISDQKFRHSEGNRVHDYLQTSTDFENKLASILNTPNNNEDVFNEYRTVKNYNHYINLQNKYRRTILFPLISFYGLQIICLFPKLVLPIHLCLVDLLKAYLTKIR